MTADGLICWSKWVRNQWITVGLVVKDGRVVDCPPWANNWARGEDARELWRHCRRHGADLVWIPDERITELVEALAPEP